MKVEARAFLCLCYFRDERKDLKPSAYCWVTSQRRQFAFLPMASAPPPEDFAQDKRAEQIAIYAHSASRSFQDITALECIIISANFQTILAEDLPSFWFLPSPGMKLRPRAFLIQLRTMMSHD